MQQPSKPSFSLTESFCPNYRKGDMRHLSDKDTSVKEREENESSIEPLIHNIYQTLNCSINNLSELFKRRMLMHQEEILSIAHSEIKKMQSQSSKIIKKYSELIQQRNISHQLLDLKYQVLYYQKRACDLYDQNQHLRNKIKRMKQQIVLLKIGEQTDQIALKNISKKYLKEKTLKLKLLNSSHPQRDNSFIQKSDRRIMDLSKIMNPESVFFSKNRQKGKSQPLYFRKSQFQENNSAKIKINSLKERHLLKTQI